jgi:hypothetical protein
VVLSGSLATAETAAASGAPPCGAAMAEGSKVLVFVAHVQRELT